MHWRAVQIKYLEESIIMKNYFRLKWGGLVKPLDRKIHTYVKTKTKQKNKITSEKQVTWFSLKSSPKKYLEESIIMSGAVPTPLPHPIKMWWFVYFK